MAANATKRTLFIPSDCIDWSPPAQHLLPADFPIQVGMLAADFPFRRPILFGTDPQDPITYNHMYDSAPLRFAARELAMAPRTTSSAAYTTTASEIRELHDKGLGLKTVLRSHEMWNNFIQYTLGPNQAIPNDHENPIVPTVNGIRLDNVPPNIPAPANAVPPMNINAWDPTDNWPLPEPGRQANAIFSLYDHYDAHIRRPTPFVNSEPAVRTEFIRQYLTPVNLYLESRIQLPATNYYGEWTERPDGRRMYEPSRELLGHSNYPFWSHSVKEEHRDAGLHSKKLAGFPDTLLFAEGKHGSHPAIAEIKTWWTYTTTEFHNIWALADSPVAGDGTFDWHNTSPMGGLLRQVWGELHFFDSRFGVWTNGQVIAAFVKTGDNELTFTDCHAWTDPDALTVVAGLSLAAVHSQADGADVNDIVEQLCPAATRRTPVQEGLRV